MRITVRGDEMHLPFRIYAGRDYATGEVLEAVAARIAHDVVSGRYALGEDATTRSTWATSWSASPTPPSCTVVLRDVPGNDCEGDSEPVDIATATHYAR